MSLAAASISSDDIAPLEVLLHGVLVALDDLVSSFHPLARRAAVGGCSRIESYEESRQGVYFNR